MFKRRTIPRHDVVEEKIVREANLALQQLDGFCKEILSRTKSIDFSKENGPSVGVDQLRPPLHRMPWGQRMASGRASLSCLCGLS
jgi:hypothetical protein